MSIVQLTINNHNDVLKLFADDLINYHFLVNDLLKNNYYGNGFRVYGEYENGELASILLNNFENLTYYSKTLRDVSVYLEIFKDLSFKKLSGPSQLMIKFLPFIKVKRDTRSHLGVVKAIKVKRTHPEIEISTVKSESDLSMQYELLSAIDEFKSNIPSTKEEFIESESKKLTQNNNRRTVFLSIGSDMVSSASTARKCKTSAIIVGVCSNPNYRNKGYGTELLIGLFEELLKEGKWPYLFYTNPVARRVYKNLGVDEVCEWRVMELE